MGTAVAPLSRGAWRPPSLEGKEPVVTDGEGRVIYALQPRQMEALMLTPLVPGPFYEHIGYGGAAGGGKSLLARVVATMVALMWPGSRCVIFRKTFAEVETNHVVPFKREVPEEGLYSYNETKHLVSWFNGSLTEFGQLKHRDDITKKQGGEYDCMIFEEATHYQWAWISWLTRNRLRASVDGAIPFALYPSNPGNVGHAWYKRLFVDHEYEPNERADSYAFVPARLDDNAELLRRDPGYRQRLDQLEEPHRSWLRDGDFTAGGGMALPGVTFTRHLIEPFPIPAHWARFGALDWGYDHPGSFGYYATSEAARVYKLETVVFRNLQPADIAERCLTSIPAPHGMAYVATGLDAFMEKGRSYGLTGPTIADVLIERGLPVIPADVRRKFGLSRLRDYLAIGKPAAPVPLQFFNTEGNRRCIKQLADIPLDPDDTEDALKQDADEYGIGGDDMYDETRYALASRPPVPRAVEEEDFDAWSKETLEAEFERGHRSRTRGTVKREEVLHPEFGAFW